MGDELKQRYLEAVSSGDDSNADQVRVEFSNGSDCMPGCAITNSGGRKLQGSSSRDIIATFFGLAETASSEDVRENIVQEADAIENVVATNPALVSLGVSVDVTQTTSATNPPTFAPTQSPTIKALKAKSSKSLKA